MNTKPTLATSNKTAPKSKSRAKVAVVAGKAMAAKAITKAVGKAYEGRCAGSRKEAVHKYYDANGREKALTFGKTKGLKVSSLNQWFNTWARGAK